MHRLFGHKKRKKPAEDMGLQITSMADVFTIILVFLLKSTASGVSSVSPNGASLPMANGGEITKETIKVEVSRDTVMVDDKNVVKLANFEFPINEVQANGMSQSVFQAFSATRTSKQETNSNSTLLVLADQDTPYSTLKSVLSAAANTGYVDLQLVVVGDN